MPRKRSSDRFRAVFECEYTGGKSESIARALQVDNKSTSDTTVETVSKGEKVVTTIESISLEKLLPVLDDVISCQALCERTLDLTDGAQED